MRDGAYDDRKADFYEAFGLGMFHVTHPEVQLFVSLSVIVCNHVCGRQRFRPISRIAWNDSKTWVEVYSLISGNEITFNLRVRDKVNVGDKNHDLKLPL
jgi:hypothetical protein